MKILLKSRVDLFEKSGGDTTQILKTSEYLKKLGVLVDISTKTEEDLKDYDLVHLFNISPRVHETYLQCINAKKQKKPIVLSPIYVNPEEIIEYDNRNRYGVLNLLSRIIPSLSLRETVKNLFRGIKDQRQLKAAVRQLLIGYRNQQRTVLQLSDYWIGLAKKEIEQIKNDFGFLKEYSIIPNAVEKYFTNTDSNTFIKKYGIKDFVLCVGRIETLKNQLVIIQALKDTDLKLVIVGKLNPLHKKYSQTVLKEIAKNRNILYIPEIPHNEIGSAFAAAKVHVLASWYEVVPLVDWEAGLAGCNVVTTIKGYSKEYLKDMVWYCDPSNVNSIRDAILNAYHASKSDKLKNYVLENFSWGKTAQKTLEVYKTIVK